MEFDKDQLDRLEQIFMPRLVSSRAAFFEDDPLAKVRLAHYTSAETAIKIIRSKSLWLRNARDMQDYSEVQYGHKLGYSYFVDQDRRERFLSIFARDGENPARSGIEIFDQWQADLTFRTFLTCFSAHGFDCEPHGRLSMWRSFGGSTPSVALILNAPEIYSAAPMNCFLTPVAYPRNDEDHWKTFDEIVTNAEGNIDYLKTLPSDAIKGVIAMVLLMNVVSVKHPAFREEREWRLCHFPGIVPSEHVEGRIESVRGIPQVVQEVPLVNKAEAGISGISLPELLEEVKIGPTQHADVISQALVAALSEAGVPDAEQKIQFSEIPLRDWGY